MELDGMGRNPVESPQQDFPALQCGRCERCERLLSGLTSNGQFVTTNSFVKRTARVSEAAVSRP